MISNNSNKIQNSTSTIPNLNGTYIEIVSRSHNGMPYTINLEQKGDEIIGHYDNPKVFVCTFHDTGTNETTKINLVGTIIKNASGFKISGMNTYCEHSGYNAPSSSGLYMGSMKLNVSSSGNVLSGQAYPPDSTGTIDTMALTRIK